MRIVTVDYKRLVSFGHFENQTLGAVAEVDIGESPVEALQKLKEWVLSQNREVVLVHENKDVLQQEVYRLRHEKDDLERWLNDARSRWAEAKRVLEKHGVDVGNIEIPF